MSKRRQSEFAAFFGSARKSETSFWTSLTAGSAFDSGGLLKLLDVLKAASSHSRADAVDVGGSFRNGDRAARIEKIEDVRAFQSKIERGINKGVWLVVCG